MFPELRQFNSLSLTPYVSSTQVLLDIRAFSNSRSPYIALSFQWVICHVGLSGNELAHSLAKTDKTHPLLHLIGTNLFHSFFFCRFTMFPQEKLPRLARCELFHFAATVTSLLLPSYLCRIKRENSSCSVCGHQLQHVTHLLLDCPASESHPSERVRKHHLDQVVKHLLRVRVY